MSRRQKKWMKILKKAKSNSELYKKYKYDYLKKEDNVTGTKCARGCNRLLTDAELKAPNKACYHCLRDNTFNKIRCNGCDLVMEIPPNDEQLCSECREYQDKTTVLIEDKIKKEGEGKKASTTTTVSYTKDPCTHKGTPLVFTIGEGKVYAGGSKDMDDWSCLDDIDFILRLTGAPAELVEWNKSAEVMFGKDWLGSLCSPIPTVGISWPDMGSPPFGLTTVTRIVEKIYGGKKMLVHCVGGHGRTGTMLVAIAHAAGLIPEKHKDKPIHWLRKLYCEKAVESLSQREWLVGIGALPEVGSYSDYNEVGTGSSTYIYKWCETHKTGLTHECDKIDYTTGKEKEVKQTSSLPIIFDGTDEHATLGMD